MFFLLSRKIKFSILQTCLYLFILGCCFFRLFTNRRKVPSQIFLSLTSNQVSNQKGKNFVDFIFQERIKFNYPKDHILLEIRNFSNPRFISNQSNLTVCRDLPTFIFVRILVWRDIFSLLRVFIKNDLNYNDAKNMAENFKLIKSRNFDQIIWTYFNKNNFFKGDLLTTQTHLNKLPVYFKGDFEFVNRIMLWYSLNSNVIARKKNQLENRYISTEILENIDQHFIWNNVQLQDLKLQGIPESKLKIVGSIVFLPKEINYFCNDPKEFITYFDITPIRGKDNFYSEELAIQTLNLILHAVELYNKKSLGKITLRIKPKRSPQRIHSKKYLDFVQKLANLEKIHLLAPDTNLYSCIQESIGVIALPYSSPVFIAEEFGIPNTYVFEDNNVWDVPKRHGIEIQRNVVDLLNWLDQIARMPEMPL